MIQTEVVVIGAGPAGSVAGAALARRGREVVCLEAGTFPRFQIGESLLPRSSDVLEQAGLLEAVNARRYQVKNGAVFLRGRSERERYSFAEMFPGQRPQTFQVPRADFDQTLATAARRLGVDVRFNHRVEAVETSAGAVKVVATDLEGPSQVEISARQIIDCSGYGRVLPRLLSLERPSEVSPRAALFNRFEGDARPEGDSEGDIWVCVHPRGAWIWIIPFSNGRTSVGVVAEQSLLETTPGSDRDKLLALLREDPNAGPRLAEAVPVLKTGRLGGWSTAVDRFYGPGWALTGNAGEFLDPVFSSGVTLAVETAFRAAVLTDRQLAGEAVDWEREYAAVVNKAVGVFKIFVQSWYRGDLPKVLLARDKTDLIKRSITAVLGGYVLDDRNPFVKSPESTLEALLKFL